MNHHVCGLALQIKHFFFTNQLIKEAKRRQAIQQQDDKEHLWNYSKRVLKSILVC